MFFAVQFLSEFYAIWQYQMTHLNRSVEEEANIPLWGMPSKTTSTVTETAEPVEEMEHYEVSQIEEKHVEFFDTLIDSIADLDCMSETEEYPFVYEEDDFIHMDSWNEEPEPVSVTSKLSSKATTKIIDCIMGEQLWVVEVVGEEQGHLHVSDGTARSWVFTGNFGTFYKGDILSLSVNRDEHERITVTAIELLQRRSEEFSIPDEVEYEELESEIA